MSNRDDREQLLDMAELEVEVFMRQMASVVPPGPDESESGMSAPGHMWATVLIAREFVSNGLLREAYLEAEPEFVERQPLNDGLLHALVGHLKETRAFLKGRDDRGIHWSSDFGTVAKRFTDLRELFRQAMQRLRYREDIALTPVDIDRLTEQLLDIDDRLRILDASASVDEVLDKINTAQEKAEKSATKASTAAGRAGGDTIFSFYQDFADAEGVAADRYRKWTIWAGLGAGLTAAVFLILPEFGALRIEANDYVHLVQRVVVTVAVFGMAGYFARQAHQHRVLANWASAMAVQLKTFEAYVDPIEDQAVRDDLRKTFAGRAFGDHPAMKGEATPSPTPAAIEAAMQLIAKIAPGTK
jgi:hypothetical protein